MVYIFYVPSFVVDCSRHSLHLQYESLRGVATILKAVSASKPHSAGTGRTVFSKPSAAVVRHKPNDGVVVYAIRASLNYDKVK